MHTELRSAAAIVLGCVILTLCPPAARDIRNNAALTTLEAGVFDGLTVSNM